MEKKDHVPAKAENAFENAMAEFERAVEDPPSAGTAADAPPAEPLQETPVPGDTQSESGVPVDTVAPVTETAVPEDAAADTPSETVAPEEPASETAVPADTPPETVVSGDAPSENDVSGDTPAENNVSGDTPSDNDVSAENEADDGQASGEPDTPDEASGGENAAEPLPTATEPDKNTDVVKTERHGMETKEFTFKRHHDGTRSKETDSEKGKPVHYPKPPFKPLDQIKNSFHVPSERSRTHRDDNPPSEDKRYADIRKRVMQMQDEETRNYLLSRVLPQMSWYDDKSVEYQSKYYFLMSIAIVLSAMIPVFSIVANHIVIKVILALLGVSVTAINAYIALRHYHDLAIAYRLAAEDLVHILYCYFNGAGVFSKKETQPESVLLVDICEDTISKENSGWRSIVSSKAVQF